MKSPYEKIYKTWLFRWIIYNPNYSYSKKEFIELEFWKQHLIFFGTSSFTIWLTCLLIYKFIL